MKTLLSQKLGSNWHWTWYSVVWATAWLFPFP